MHSSENTMLRTIHGYRRKPDESHSMCVQRITHKMRILYHRPHQESSNPGRKCVCQLVLERIHRVAGCFRLQQHDLSSQRMLPQILAHRDTIWWLWRQAVGTVCAPLDSSWKHAQPGRPARRWDGPSSKLVVTSGHIWQRSHCGARIDLT